MLRFISPVTLGAQMSSTRGDKPTIRGSESDKKAFTAFVIGVFKEKGTRLYVV
jgi:hypothetical protein